MCGAVAVRRHAASPALSIDLTGQASGRLKLFEANRTDTVQAQKHAPANVKNVGQKHAASQQQPLV